MTTQDFSQAPINAQLSNEQKIEIFRKMSRIRRFEGTMSLCGPEDHVITAYRCHAHALTSGMSMNECMAELFGKATGCSKGKGGSMHFFAPDKNFWGGHGIVAGQTPLGLGLAFAQKYKGKKGACLCYMGDGAVNQGAFHESLNIAELFSIPVVYIIENNGYSMGTSQSRSSAYKETLAKRAEAYDMAWATVNGEDIYEVRAKTQEAIERAHELSKPTILEIFTYKEALKFAEESPFPEIESIFDDVYWEVDEKTAAGTTGRHFFND